MMLYYLADGRVQRSGGKGSAKPKPCAKCEGKGWTFIQTQVCVSSFLIITTSDVFEDWSKSLWHVKSDMYRV